MRDNHADRTRRMRGLAQAVKALERARQNPPPPPPKKADRKKAQAAADELGRRRST